MAVVRVSHSSHRMMCNIPRTRIMNNNNNITLNSVVTSCVKWLMIAAVIISSNTAAVAATATATADTNSMAMKSTEYSYHSQSNTLTTHVSYTSNENEDGRRNLLFKNHTIITIPLIPHSTVQQRRRLSASTKGQHEKVERPSHSKYHYMRLLEEAQQHDQLTMSQHTRNEVVVASKALQMAGLFQGYGTHYADLWCGSPIPQRQTVIVDTGSGVTAFPCNECENCGVPTYHIDPLFDETSSSSFTKLTCIDCLRGECSGGDDDTCTFGMSYQEGSSWNAFEASDLCYVGGFHDRPTQEDKDNTTQDQASTDIDPFHAPAFAFQMKFGCQTRITGLFITQLADGIMGMDIAEPAFWYQMYRANKIQHKAFSLCFSRKDDVERTGTESGAMSLGGTDDRLHLTPPVYTSTTEGSGFYVVHVRKMYLRAGGGGLSAESTNTNIKIVQLDLDESALNSGRVIVDSGTTDTYFSRRIRSAFEDVFKQLTGEAYDHSVKHFTKEELAQQPTILFQLAGDEVLNQKQLDDFIIGHLPGLAGALDKDHPLDVLLAVPPEHYYEYDEEANGYISRFYDDESGGGVIGANSMMGHDVFFDVENDRIGWAESNCDYTEIVKRYTDKDWEPATPPPDETSRVEPEGNDMGDGPADVNDEQSGTYKSPVETKVCNGLSCQISVLVGVVAIISLVAYRVIRRVPTGPSYEMADSELELRNVSEEVTNIEDHDEFVNNRRRRAAEFT